MTNLLQLQNVSRQFADVKAVNAVSLDVQAGQFITLLGPSGCGKTTTLRLIAGFEAPDGGSIYFKDRLIAGQGVFVPPKDRHIGMVFQDYALFPHLNVSQNIAFGLRSSRAVKQARVAEMLELVSLQDYATRMPYELSGGQQQRVALARALAPNPDMLLLDEPFSNLDAALRVQVRSEMRAILRAANSTCIFVTHSQEEALSLSDQVVVMFNGQVLQTASPKALYENPKTPEIAAFVGEANMLEGHASGDTANCVLGKVPLLSPAQGKVWLLIRPERLTLLPARTENTIAARVLWQEYYGHDQRMGVVLSDDTQLIIRLDVWQEASIGGQVFVQVNGPALAYPK